MRHTVNFFISVVTLYDPIELYLPEDTPLEELSGGDYTGIQVCVWQAGKLVASADYGDHYHDKGKHKAEAFVEGFYEAVSNVLAINLPVHVQHFSARSPVTEYNDLDHLQPTSQIEEL